MTYLNRTPAARNHCEACFDEHYITSPKGDFARAKRCERCRVMCSVCHGDGVTFHQRSDGYQVVVDCRQCTNLEKRIKRFNEAKVPARYHDKTFGNFNVYADDAMRKGKNASLTAIREMLGTYAMVFLPKEPGVLITGKVGTGKTHLMVAFIHYLTLEKGMQCRFIEFTHLLSELREAYETRKSATDILNNLSSVPILFIDELGKGRNSDWELTIIDELISKRYNACLPTFFTTNYVLGPLKKPTDKDMPDMVDTDKPEFPKSMARETLDQRVSERIVSRICEMCNIITIDDDVPDFRERQRQRRQQAVEKKLLGASRGPLTRPR